jgi:hypothetical protein
MAEEVQVNEKVTVDTIPADQMIANTGDGNPYQPVTGESFDTKGAPEDIADALALVVQSANSAKAFIANKQWILLWRDADLLYQAPRPMTVYENTYVLEPNVQRFTVAKVCNAVVPQLYKGLFYDDPPMILRPEPNTHQSVTDAKSKLFNVILDECKFKQQTKWGLENMACFGTGIWKWGYDWKTRKTFKRKKSSVKIDLGGDGTQILNLPTDEIPDIEVREYVVPLPFFEWRPVDKVLVDPHLAVADIREARWAIDVQYMDWYEFSDLMIAIQREVGKGKHGEWMKGWRFPSEKSLKEYWNKVPSTDTLETEQATYMEGVVHHAQKVNIQVSPNPLRNKLEILEYYDKGNKILVLNKAWVFFKGKNEFEVVPFLSANWWNRPRAFYGMGLGMIVGQNQRVDQGTINAILKILSFGVNPVYLRSRDDNAPTQMLRTSLGKILTVSDLEKGYKLMETPKTPPDIWTALSESEKATESSSGADQALVQGSSAGPRSSMGRTAGGANLLAGASATRLDGPLDNFIDQVFKPFLSIIDMIIYKTMSDGAILRILGDEYGHELIKNLDLEAFHSARFEYEVLAGASLSAKRTMAQSMVLLTQIFQNPQIQESLAEINEEYIDYKPILTMWLEASEWRNKQDIIKPMTAAMKAKRAQNSKAALMQMQIQAKQQGDAQKFQQKQQLEDQASDNRIKRDVIREVSKQNVGPEVTGEPTAGGLQGEMPTVV